MFTKMALHSNCHDSGSQDLNICIADVHVHNNVRRYVKVNLKLLANLTIVPGAKNHNVHCGITIGCMFQKQLSLPLVRISTYMYFSNRLLKLFEAPAAPLHPYAGESDFRILLVEGARRHPT